MTARNLRAGWLTLGCAGLLGAACPTTPLAHSEDNAKEPSPEWRQWRGPRRDGLVRGFAAPATWPGALTRVWVRTVGDGYSSPIGDGASLYVHSRRADEEVVTALDLKSGEPRWSRSYPAPSRKTEEFAKSEGEGPYATPTLHGGQLYTVGVHGVVSSFRANDGDLTWRRDLSSLIVEIERFCGTAPSPLVAGDRLVVQIGDDDSGEVLALDLDSGETLWQTQQRGAANASPLIAEIDGVRQIVAVDDRSVFGLDSQGGELLWTFPFPAPAGSCSLNIPTPLLRDSTLVVSALDRGTVAIGISRTAGGWSAEQRWSNETLAPQLTSPLGVSGPLFGLSHKRKGQLHSLDPETGELLWSGEGRLGENGFLVDLGDRLLVLLEGGDLLVAAKAGDRLEIQRRYTVSDTTVWSHPLVTHGGIVVRDQGAVTLWSFAENASILVASSWSRRNRAASLRARSRLRRDRPAHPRRDGVVSATAAIPPPWTVVELAGRLAPAREKRGGCEGNPRNSPRKRSRGRILLARLAVRSGSVGAVDCFSARRRRLAIGRPRVCPTVSSGAERPIPSGGPCRPGQPDLAQVTKPASSGSPSLRVLGLVDLHWSPRRRLELPVLEGVDLVLLGGDLTHFRGGDEAREVIERVREKGPQVLAVCGNCDQPEIEETMQEMGVALDRRAELVGDVTFVGLSAGLPFGGCPYERTEEDYELACRQASEALHSLDAAERPWVLVSHQPPHDTRCDLAHGVHVGSKAIRRFIEKEQPDLVLCGHIHEAVGSDRIGSTQVVNPGPWFAGHALRFRVSGGAIEIE